MRIIPFLKLRRKLFCGGELHFRHAILSLVAFCLKRYITSEFGCSRAEQIRWKWKIRWPFFGTQGSSFRSGAVNVPNQWIFLCSLNNDFFKTFDWILHPIPLNAKSDGSLLPHLQIRVQTSQSLMPGSRFLVLAFRLGNPLLRSFREPTTPP